MQKPPNWTWRGSRYLSWSG